MDDKDDINQEIIETILINKKLNLNEKRILYLILIDLENKFSQNPHDYNLKNNIENIKNIINK